MYRYELSGLPHEVLFWELQAAGFEVKTSSIAGAGAGLFAGPAGEIFDPFPF